jgi:hypothetical protein
VAALLNPLHTDWHGEAVTEEGGRGLKFFPVLRFVPMKEIMGVDMFVSDFPVSMHMFMDEIHLEEQVNVLQHIICPACFFQAMFL